MSCKIEYPLVSYPRIVFDTQVGEDGLHLLYVLVSSIYHC